MKNIKLLLVLIIMTGCSNSLINKQPITLELINDSVNYITIDSTDLINSESKSFEQLRFYSQAEKKAALNVLTFKLINNSTKKFYFVLDVNDIDYFGNSSDFKKSTMNDSVSIRRICYLVDNKTKGKNVRRVYNNDYFPNYKNDSMNVYFKKYMEIEGKINRDNYQAFADEASVNHSFVIYPGEYKIFKKKLFLPIDVEKDRNHFFNFSTLILSPQYQYDFSLAISSNKKDIWNSLHDYQRKEIQDNGYEIFDGTIMSKKIALKSVQIR